MREAAFAAMQRHIDIFWIATCVDGHWGIQVRSSHLR